MHLPCRLENYIDFDYENLLSPIYARPMKIISSLRSFSGCIRTLFSNISLEYANIKTNDRTTFIRKIIWSYQGVMAGQHPFLIDNKTTTNLNLLTNTNINNNSNTGFFF